MLGTNLALWVVLATSGVATDTRSQLRIVLDWDGISPTIIPVSEMLSYCKKLDEHKELDKATRLAVLLRRSDAELIVGNTSAASESARKALELDPENTDALWKRGHALWFNSKKEQAWGLAQRLIQTHSNSPYGYYLAACHQLDLLKYEKAIYYCDLSIQKNDQFARAYTMRALARLKIGQCEACLRDVDKAMCLPPTESNEEASLYLLRGNALFALERFGEAAANLIQAKRKRPPGPLQMHENATDFLLWDCYSQQKKYALALALSEEMATKCSDSGAIHSLRSRSLAQMGRLEESEKAADLAVKLAPKHPGAWAAKGIVHQFKGDHHLAIFSYTQSSDLEPSDIFPNIRYDVIVRMAFLLSTCPEQKFRNGEIAKLAAKTAASHVKPVAHQRTARIVLALALAECGEFKKATEALRTAMKLGELDTALQVRCKKLEAQFDQNRPYRHDSQRPQDHLFSIDPGCLVYTRTEPKKEMQAPKDVRQQ